jgi:hypothetical protein
MAVTIQFLFILGFQIWDMISGWEGWEMFEGDFADMCAETFPNISMGVWMDERTCQA